MLLISRFELRLCNVRLEALVKVDGAGDGICDGDYNQDDCNDGWTLLEMLLCYSATATYQTTSKTCAQGGRKPPVSCHCTCAQA